MSYYIWCDNVEVVLRNHEHYSSREEVLEQIEENKEQIERHKRELFGLCCGKPADLLSTKDVEGNDFDPIEALQFKFDRIFDDEVDGIAYLIAHNVDLQYIADNWDKHQEG